VHLSSTQDASGIHAIPIVIPAGYILRLDRVNWTFHSATRVFVSWVAFTLTRARHSAWGEVITYNFKKMPVGSMVGSTIFFLHFSIFEENKSSILPRTSPCQARVSVNATHSKKAVFEIFEIFENLPICLKKATGKSHNSVNPICHAHTLLRKCTHVCVSATARASP